MGDPGSHAAPLRLAVIEHMAEVLVAHPRILHGIDRMAVSQLLLHCRDVARLGHDMLAHRVPGTVRGSAVDASRLTHHLPNVIDRQYG